MLAYEEPILIDYGWSQLNLNILIEAEDVYSKDNFRYATPILYAWSIGIKTA